MKFRSPVQIQPIQIQLAKLYSTIGAAYLIILGGIALSASLDNPQYWSIGVPSAVTILTADTLSKGFGKNNRGENDGKNY